MAVSQLVCEVWCKSTRHGLQYRGMVRRGLDYIHQGQWISSQVQAAKDANKAASKIDRAERNSVRH